jgi:tetratricopeptide (TPR) repeat protein
MPTSPTRSAREAARELELDAVRYPEQRGEILLEAAGQWKDAGELERATVLLGEVLGAGGVDADFARYSLAELCFERGSDVEAWGHLKALEDAGPCDPGPTGLVAELLEQRGEHEAALHWFDRAISLLEPDEVNAVGKPGGSPSINAALFFGRQRCRQRLGLPADDLDRVADVAEQNRRDFVDLLERASGTAAKGSPGKTSAGATMLIWQREEQQRAARRWPKVFPPDVIGHHPQVDQHLRDMCRDQGITKVTLVPGTVEGFAAYLDRTGGDPADEEVRLAYADEAYEQGQHIPWPPGRNQPCWCGSGRKYKRCCGGPRAAG